MEEEERKEETKASKVDRGCLRALRGRITLLDCPDVSLQNLDQMTFLDNHESRWIGEKKQKICFQSNTLKIANQYYLHWSTVWNTYMLNYKCIINLLLVHMHSFFFTCFYFVRFFTIWASSGKTLLSQTSISYTTVCQWDTEDSVQTLGIELWQARESFSANTRAVAVWSAWAIRYQASTFLLSLVKFLLYLMILCAERYKDA